MKLHFEPNLHYQIQATEAVCDLFSGQEICRTEFTVARGQAAKRYPRVRTLQYRRPPDAQGMSELRRQGPRSDLLVGHEQ